MIDNNQKKKIAKYNIGMPNTALFTLNINITGILRAINKAKERITNFCSCLFFMCNFLWYKVK